MTKRTPTNLPASVHQLLLNKAHKANRPFNEVLQYYAMERFLYRLSKSPHAARFILKGALMFTAWKYDIWTLSRQFDFDGHTLGNAIAKTFSNRGTTIAPEPVGLTAKFADDLAKKTQWRGFIRRCRLDASPDLGEVLFAIASFLGPLVTILSAGGSFQGKWTAPGPWMDNYRTQLIV